MNKVNSSVTLAGGSAFTILSLFMEWMIAGFPKPVPTWLAPTCAMIVLWAVHFLFNLLSKDKPAVAAAIAQAVNSVETKQEVQTQQGAAQ